ncbi:hypothetical protein QBC46DRAFT_297 [Diplogelasinospora grovesii]|uniref:Uncharacterized protein n=1 Tax=Diplogelasinospora grovesii TaxID=303347 RepID=A0AAN6S9J6_9PEZI|nr:hypothetical protein QBC46DRAFT_297 [Diplogelasinospora grovesii]
MVQHIWLSRCSAGFYYSFCFRECCTIRVIIIHTLYSTSQHFQVSSVSVLFCFLFYSFYDVMTLLSLLDNAPVIVEEPLYLLTYNGKQNAWIKGRVNGKSNEES